MDNPLVSCPYNPLHKVLRSRIQGHIVKCEKKYPQLEICPYNATHRFNKIEMMQHVSECHSKEVETKKSHPRLLSTTIANQHYAYPSDPDYECWD